MATGLLNVRTDEWSGSQYLLYSVESSYSELYRQDNLILIDKETLVDEETILPYH
jgi:hypothetical protein